jgi:hypothetical protein
MNKSLGKRPVGRPEFLDERKRKLAITLLSNGSSRRVVAEYFGCGMTTLARTMERHPEFAEAVEAAEHSLELECLNNIRKAGRKDRYWRAAAWLMERKNAKDFARRPFNGLSEDEMLRLFVKVLEPLWKSIPFEDIELFCDGLKRLMHQIEERPQNIDEILALPKEKPEFGTDWTEAVDFADSTTSELDDLDDELSSQDYASECVAPTTIGASVLSQ